VGTENAKKKVLKNSRGPPPERDRWTCQVKRKKKLNCRAKIEWVLQEVSSSGGVVLERNTRGWWKREGRGEDWVD